jgi:hypothetical protein
MDEMELQELMLLRVEADELHRLIGIAHKFLASKSPEDIRVGIIRAQIDYVPAPA